MQNESYKLGREVIVLMATAILALVLIDIFNLDFIFADLIYAPTQSWQYQEAWITSELMHKYGKYSLILLYLIALVAFFFRNKQTETSKQRYGKVILLISLLLGTSTVALLKHSLEMDCPWDLIRYGGDKPFFSMFNYASTLLPSSHCFPSGHASSAFTWISLYFYATIFHPKYKYKILVSVLILGYVFGLGQQFRGAHFISHDVWSMLVCLLVNVLIYKVAFSKMVLNRVLSR